MTVQLSRFYAGLPKSPDWGAAMRCEVCGVPIRARAGKRFCSDRCRKRSRRARGLLAVVETLPDDFDPESHDLVIVTRQVLEDAGAADTLSGRLAVIMAQQAINPNQSATGMVACIRQLEACVAAALSSIKRGDRLDDLLRRRDVKIRRALRDSAADDE